MSAYPPNLAEIVDLFEQLPEEEMRENLIAYADGAANCALKPGEAFDLEDTRKDEECTDTVGVFLRVDPGTRANADARHDRDFVQRPRWIDARSGVGRAAGFRSEDCGWATGEVEKSDRVLHPDPDEERRESLAESRASCGVGGVRATSHLRAATARLVAYRTARGGARDLTAPTSMGGRFACVGAPGIGKLGSEITSPGWWNGRHDGLRSRCREACRFESCPGHHQRVVRHSERRLSCRPSLQQRRPGGRCRTRAGTICGKELGRAAR